jgi:hypothetical protein
MATSSAKSGFLATQVPPTVLEDNRMEVVNRCCRHSWNQNEYRAREIYCMRVSIVTRVGVRRKEHIDNG